MIVSSTFCLILVNAGWILSIQGWVVPHSTNVSAPFWLVVLLQAVFFMVFVDFCFSLCLYLFADSTRCHILLEMWPWFCICGRFPLGKTYLGAVAMAGPGGILKICLKYANIGWSSIRHYQLFIIDYWSSINPHPAPHSLSSPSFTHTCSHTALID